MSGRRRIQPKIRDATKSKAHRSCLLELPKIAVAIVPQQLPCGFRHLAFIYPSRSGRKSRTLRRRLHSVVGVGLIPCARAARFGMLLAFGWIRRRPDTGNDPCRPQTMSDKLVAATLPGKPHERTMRPPNAPRFSPYHRADSVSGVNPVQRRNRLRLAPTL
jgi:hypothetical protein